MRNFANTVVVFMMWAVTAQIVFAAEEVASDGVVQPSEGLGILMMFLGVVAIIAISVVMAGRTGNTEG